jgi:hypothetical protein
MLDIALSVLRWLNSAFPVLAAFAFLFYFFVIFAAFLFYIFILLPTQLDVKTPPPGKHEKAEGATGLL